MEIGTISVRYARALYKYALEQNEEHTVYTEMENLSGIYSYEPRLRLMIENPSMTLEQKESLLNLACGANVCKSTKRFIKLVVSKRRADFMQFIANSYIRLYLEEKNIVKSRLIAPVKLSRKLIDKIRAVVENRTNSKIDFTIEEDPSITGGFILEYGTYRIDATVNSQINKIRHQLRTSSNVC